MKTYQDLTQISGDESARMKFILKLIEEHRGSAAYKTASVAEQYYAKKNVTIMQFQKVLYNMQGQAVPDLWSANYKLRTLFFRRFVLQQVQYVLANGVTFGKKETKARLGRDFDTRIQQAAKKAMVDGVSFCFWNHDHVEVFPFADTLSDTGFAPLYDGGTGELCAGVRYWNPGEDLRATLYEIDGFTECIKRKDKPMEVLKEKRAYKLTTASTNAGGVLTVTGENYERLPIVPLYANDLRESEIEGIRESIDCYDFIKSGFANDIDDTVGFYWALKGTGDMDDVSLAKFIERMKTVRAASLPEGMEAVANTLDIPTEARETMLDRLEKDLYRDFQIVNVEALSAANRTATEIRAAYQPMDDKCGDFEYFLIDCIQGILKLAGLQDDPSFRYNRIANQSEETSMVMAAAYVLGDKLTLKKLPFLTPEEVEDRLNEIGDSVLTQNGFPGDGE